MTYSLEAIAQLEHSKEFARLHQIPLNQAAEAMTKLFHDPKHQKLLNLIEVLGAESFIS